tara:strand:- start:117 stop:572 length:456 start_codon:yes stop_codon:yes gene_type:complete
MVIDTYVLLAYATVWTIFYWFLSQYISSLSRDKWVEYVRSEESDDMLVEALAAVIEEIEIRMHEKLEQFQSSFFGSVGQMVKKGKDLDPMNNIRKAAKDGDWTSMLVEYAANKSGLGAFLPQNQPQEGTKEQKTSPKTGLVPKKLKDLLGK